MKQTAIYARASTKDQEPMTQLRELRAYAKRRGLRVIEEFIDRESGASTERKHLARLMDLGRKRKVDVVLAWKFDRFARSTKQIATSLEQFQDLGIDFDSYAENVDTSTPAGKATFTMVSAFAEFERDLIRERVIAGLDRARKGLASVQMNGQQRQYSNPIRPAKRTNVPLTARASIKTPSFPPSFDCPLHFIKYDRTRRACDDNDCVRVSPSEIRL